MKLRLRGNSLRLRLNRSEVADLIRTGTLEEAVAFGPHPEQRLVYAVGLVPGGEEMAPTASLEGARVLVQLPLAAAQAWAEGDMVGLYAETDWGLKIAVEKDFKCLEPRTHEDESDAFDHPGGTSHCKV